MSRLVLRLALSAVLVAPLGCNKEEPAASTDSGSATPSSAPADNDPLADVPTEADYEEQADLAIDNNNFVDRLDEIEKEINVPDQG